MSEAWKPVLKGVIEFFLVARQMWMDLSEVNARAIVGEQVVGAHQPFECTFSPLCITSSPGCADPWFPDGIAMDERCA